MIIHLYTFPSQNIHVVAGKPRSKGMGMENGVSNGSTLGPILLVLYTRFRTNF